MIYTNVKDIRYKGYDISIFTHEDDTYTLDIKTDDGEIIEGLYGIESFNYAITYAKKRINNGFNEEVN